MTDRVGPSFVGMQQTDLSEVAPATRDKELADMAAAHVGLLRQVVRWNVVEPEPGAYDFRGFDAVVGAASRHHLRVLPTLLTPPLWAIAPGARGRGDAIEFPPRSPGLLSGLATRMVARYGPRGAFWRSHPRLPALPITAWQIWNEPNLPAYWRPEPDARAYVALLRATGRAIHRADPHAQVVSAGIPNSRHGVPFARWVNEFFAAGGRGTFDVFAVHAYARRVDQSVAAVAEARSLLRSHGLAHTPIWVTEWGWADGGLRSPFTVGPRVQARNVRAAMTALAARRAVLGLQGIVYFEWRDQAGPGARVSWGSYTGLVDQRGRRKPAYDAFAHTAAQLLRR